MTDTTRVHRFSLVLTHFALSGICLLFAYLAFTGKQPTVFKDAHGHVVAVRDLGAWFRTAASVAVALGVLLMINGGRLLARGGRENWQNRSRVREMARSLLASRSVWWIVNVVSLPVAVWSGYLETIDSRLQTSDYPIILCIAAILGMTFLAIGTAFFGRGNGLRKPTWDRCPLRWWTDPLQALFISTLFCFGLFVGSVLAMANIWMAAVFGSMVLGLISGQAISYCLYANWIEGGPKGSGPFSKGSKVVTH